MREDHHQDRVCSKGSLCTASFPLPERGMMARQHLHWQTGVGVCARWVPLSVGSVALVS